MRVHVSERCMGQERAREVIHGLRGRQPCGQSLEQGGSLHRRCHLFNEFHIGVIMSSDMRPTQCVRPALERPLPTLGGAWVRHTDFIWPQNGRRSPMWG